MSLLLCHSFINIPFYNKYHELKISNWKVKLYQAHKSISGAGEGAGAIAYKTGAELEPVHQKIFRLRVPALKNKLVIHWRVRKFI